MIGSRSLAQWYALAVGVACLAWGVLVLLLALVSLVASWFGAHPDLDDLAGHVLGILAWHQMLVFAAGAILGLATWRRADSARVFALITGTVLVLLALWGFFLSGTDVWLLRDGDAWLIRTTLAYDVVAAVVGVAGLVAGVVSPRHHRRAMRIPATAALALLAAAALGGGAPV